MKKYLTKKGFTLIELLVVISVITLLVGILTPALCKARRSALRTYCQTNLRSIGIALRSYLDDNNNTMPPACKFPSLHRDPNAPDYKPSIKAFLLPLLKQPDTFVCPADTVKKYYRPEKEGLSYEYNARLGGKPVSRSFLARRGIPERDIHVMSDFDPFHGKAGKPGSKNYLYADTHIGDYKKQ